MSQKIPDPAAWRFAGFENVPLRVHVKVGGARCRVATVAELGPGALLELDRRIGEPLELLAGGVLLGFVEPVAHEGGVALKLVGLPEDDDVPGR